MASSFGSFNTGLSALRYNQTLLDAANNNIANAGVAGYTRRRVAAESVGAPPTPALWSKYDGHGDGVKVTGVDRISDDLLVNRAHREGANQGYLDTRAIVLGRVEAGLNEPSDKGLSEALVTLRLAFSDLAMRPSSSAARGQLLAVAGTVTDNFHTQAQNIVREMDDQRVAIKTSVDEVNQVAADLAEVNRAITVGNQTKSANGGGDINVLLDNRDLLTAKLAKLTGASTSIASDGTATVTLGSATLVSGIVANTLSVSGIGPDGSSTGAPIAFAVTDAAGGVTATTVTSGSIGGSHELVTTTLPNYLTSLGTLAKTFADGINTALGAGFDAAGDPGTPLFSYTPGDEARSLTVALTDPAKLAISQYAGGAADGSVANAIANAGPTVEANYQVMISGMANTVATANRAARNQQVLTDQVNASVQQLSGVSTDEEMINMMTAQRGYEAASRLITVMDSVLDTLINRTGLIR